MAREQTKMITSIGGQALMEGVMMRGPKKTSVAVRLPDETIDVEELKSNLFVKDINGSIGLLSEALLQCTSL